MLIEDIILGKKKSSTNIIFNYNLDCYFSHHWERGLLWLVVSENVVGRTKGRQLGLCRRGLTAFNSHGAVQEAERDGKEDPVRLLLATPIARAL